MIDPLDPKHFPSALFARLEKAVHSPLSNGEGWSEGSLGAFLRTWWDALGLKLQPDPYPQKIAEAQYEAAIADPAYIAELEAAIAERESDGQPAWVERFGDPTSYTDEEVVEFERVREREYGPVRAASFARQLDEYGELPAAELARYLDGTVG